MNMQNLMAQAQKMKKEIQQKQKEIDEKEFVVESEFLFIKMNGNRKIIDFKINTEILKDKEDIEVLEDMIKIALKNIFEQIEKETEAKMGMNGSGLNGLI